uniref:DUF3715 domain-containing protein n=1 Tax=Setaria digitata TaxID=48799 RepID=A0A915PNA3_9BILA
MNGKFCNSSTELYRYKMPGAVPKSYLFVNSRALLPLKTSELSQHCISDVSLSSETFRNVYQPVIFSHLSNNCQDRESIRIVRCRIISNKQLEARFSSFRRSLESQWLPADVSFGYTLLSENLREMELIAQWGLSVNNNFVGDLGEPANGVYLSGHPDLVTPAPFLGRTKLRILACKILKGRCSIVNLGSYHLMPKQGYHSHAAVQPVDCKLSRHDNYRCDQIFLFEEKGTGYSKSPGNILPYAIYDVEFPPNTALSFKGTDSIVWSGSLLIGNKRYNRVSLCSLAAATKPPLLDTFEVTDLIHWTACLAFPPVLELLKPPALGEIALKKEVLLVDAQRLVYYFTLFSEDDSHDLVSLHESMRIKQAAGITIFPSVGIFILLPNGLFSDLLTLPKTAGSVFHCLYLTSDLNCSLINGAFEAMSTDENDEFVRPLLLQERIDGLDVRVQELVRTVAKRVLLSEENIDSKSRIQGEMSSANSEAIDMDIADSDDDEEKKGWRDERVALGIERSSKEHLAPSRSIDEAVSKATWLLSSDPRREKVLINRDPRKRVNSSQDLPVPSCSIVKRKILDWSSLREHSDIKEKSLASLSDFRSYSPSDAISSGGSSPKTVAQSQKSPLSSSPKLSDSEGSSVVMSFGRNQNELDDAESPASPPHEPGVFVATAPRIISDYDMRSANDSSFQLPVRQYRPPEVTPFTALASMQTMKDPASQSSSLLNPPPQNSLWDIVQIANVGDRDLSQWPRKTETIGTGDVDMRSIHTISSASDISRKTIPSTTHQVTSVMQMPIVFSNGDTDHRIISSAIQPSTSTQPPECFTNESAVHFRAHPFSSFPPVPSSGPFQYRNASASNYAAEFKQPRVYGFFNQPTIHRQPKPYFVRGGVDSSSSAVLQRRGVLMIDDTQLTVGSLDPKFFRMILERFSSWRKSSSILWWVKLHTHLRQTLALDSGFPGIYSLKCLYLSVSSNSNPELAERYAHYEEIIKKYENLKVVQTMKPHECDKNKHNVNLLLKCFCHTANANRKSSMIYLTDIEKDSSLGMQIACTGFEICCSAELSKKFDI